MHKVCQKVTSRPSWVSPLDDLVPGSSHLQTRKVRHNKGLHQSHIQSIGGTALPGSGKYPFICLKVTNQTRLYLPRPRLIKRTTVLQEAAFLYSSLVTAQASWPTGRIKPNLGKSPCTPQFSSILQQTFNTFETLGLALGILS